MGFRDVVAFSPDGTAYMTTFGPNADLDDYLTYVTVIGTGWHDPHQRSHGRLRTVARGFGSDGTAYQSTASYSGGPSIVAVINADGTIRASAELPARFSNYRSSHRTATSTRRHTTTPQTRPHQRSRFHRNGVADRLFAGRPADRLLIGAGGTLYQTIVTGDANDPGADVGGRSDPTAR